MHVPFKLVLSLVVQIRRIPLSFTSGKDFGKAALQHVKSLDQHAPSADYNIAANKFGFWYGGGSSR